MAKTSVIIPVFNEVLTITKILEKIVSVFDGQDFEIIIVDDASTDQTIKKIEDFQNCHPGIVRLIRHQCNQGKGVGLKDGLAASSGQILVIQDADFEYDSADIPSLVRPIENKEARVVYGSRFLDGKYPPGMMLPNFVANKILTFLTNFLYGAHLSDMETCYKVFHRDVLTEIKLEARGFDFEPEITAKILRKKIRIMERPVSYCARTSKEGKKIGAKDFFTAIGVLWRLRKSV